MLEIPILIACGLVVGLALGLTGGGGSNFAVPLLVYVVGVPPSQAMPLSLAAVAIVAAIGAAHALLHGKLAWLLLLPFAAGGATGMLLGRTLAGRLAGPQLQKGFALAIIALAAYMLTH